MAFMVQRNTVVHEAVPWNACGIIDKEEGILTEFKAANVFNHASLPPSLANWVAPAADFFKVNFDASWDRVSNKVEVGVVVRDHLGSFFAGLSKQ